MITLLRQELEASRIECKRLAQIRDDCEAEVRELTASLFQVSHRFCRVLLALFESSITQFTHAEARRTLGKRREKGEFD